VDNGIGDRSIKRGKTINRKYWVIGKGDEDRAAVLEDSIVKSKITVHAGVLPAI